MLRRANPDRVNCRLESCVRENRTHSSEGGEDVGPSRPLSSPQSRHLPGGCFYLFPVTRPGPISTPVTAVMP